MISSPEERLPAWLLLALPSCLHAVLYRTENMLIKQMQTWSCVGCAGFIQHLSSLAFTSFFPLQIN
jgi:hypothetical protein